MIALTVVLLLITSVILWVLVSNSVQSHNSNGREKLEKLSELIEVADSVRSSLPDSAMANYSKVIALLQSPEKDLRKLNLLAIAYVGMAHVYSETGNYSLALSNDSMAMVYALESGDKKTQAKVFLVRGISYFKLANYDTAMLCYEKAEKLAIEIGDLEIQSKIFSNRAMIYFYLGETQRTIDGFTKALSIGQKLNNEPLLAGNYMNLAIVYSNLSKNDSVFIFYERALVTRPKKRLHNT